MSEHIRKTSSLHLTRATIIIAFFSLLSRVVGLLRDRVFASRFGAGDTLDVYYAAFRIPDFLYNLLILGTLSAAFIPVFAAYKLKDEPLAHRIANSVLNFTLLAMTGLSALLVVLAPVLVPLIFPGFAGPKLADTVNLTRIMLLSPVFFSLSSVFSSILNSYKRFALVAVLPVIYNLAIIFGVLVLHPLIGMQGLAYSVVAGAFLHMVLQFPSLRRIGFHWRPSLDLRLPAVRRIARLYFPRVFAMDLSPLISAVIASTLAAGSIAVYSLANNLQAVPLGVIAVSFATVAFPVLSEAVAHNDRQTFREVFNSNLSQILFLVVPLSALMLILRAQIVRLILGAGNFNWEDTILTISALGFFALSLFAQSLIPLFSRAFYSLHNTVIPVVTGLLAAAVNVGAALVLTRVFSMGVSGLALAFSVASVVNFLLLFVLLEIKFGNLVDSKLILKIEKILIATLAMGMTAYSLLYAAAPAVNTHTVIGLGLQALLSLTGGMITYFVVGYALNLEESRHIFVTGKLWLDKIRAAFVRLGNLGM